MACPEYNKQLYHTITGEWHGYHSKKQQIKNNTTRQIKSRRTPPRAETIETNSPVVKNRSPLLSAETSFSVRDALSRDLNGLVSLDQTPVDCVPFDPGVVDVEFGVLGMETGRDVVILSFFNFDFFLSFIPARLLNFHSFCLSHILHF